MTEYSPDEHIALDTIASQLHCLPHPDGTPVRFMGTSPIGKPQQHRQRAQAAAQRASQAILYALKTVGLRVTSEPVLDVAAPDPGEPEVIAIMCGLCGATLRTLTRRNPGQPIRLDGRRFLESLRATATDCPHITAPDTSNVADVAAANQAGYRS
ncbi:hypothetical protein [Mycolicibacterium brisbanense]|uniref:Glr0330 protein n=1 Tax=Mycolicibacterium brisbanense TaxID=146020 RepID=A0A117I841_9MYCO|nr:hypothetical protein [Mycolicibacterium brisbanense]MCV7158025.1 hypothetical protein [Mycolicibacterium brisbanense]GAS92674.1 Glr0330 protein [Mycolicibacterium brisbanense]